MRYNYYIVAVEANHRKGICPSFRKDIGMTIDYEEWDLARVNKHCELVDKSLDRLRRGETMSLLSLTPELGIREGEPHTLWIPPGSPQLFDPIHDLRNIEALYASKNGKILIPIHPEPTHSEFEYRYGMSVKTLVNHMKENPDHLKPVITERPTSYKKCGYFDELFEACKEVLEGEFPPVPFQRVFRLMWKWSSRLEPDECFEETNTLFDIDSGKSLKELSVKEHCKPTKIILFTQTDIGGLRLCGFNAQVNLCFELARKVKNPRLGYYLLRGYAKYLVDPVVHFLGGFVNYDLSDIEAMAFLRLSETKTEEFEKIKGTLLQSPAARSLVLLQKKEKRINVLRGGDVDLKSLNAAIELAERYGEVGEKLADVHLKASALDLNGAGEAARRLNQVLIEQYFQEFVEWMNRETVAKTAKCLLDFGSCLITWPAILSSQIPTEWRLLLVAAMEWFKKRLYKKIGILNPKDIVEKLWRVKNWPMAQKGIPYMIWREVET